MSVSQKVRQLALVAAKKRGTEGYTDAHSAVCQALADDGISAWMVSVTAKTLISDAEQAIADDPMIVVRLSADVSIAEAGFEGVASAAVNAENALKAQRLDDLRAWLGVKYEQAVRAKDIKAVNLYGRTLFFIETGLDPNTNARQRHPFMRRLYCETRDKIDAERENTTDEIIELLKPVD